MNSTSKYISISFLIALLSCADDEVPLTLRDSDFFPLIVGSFSIYDVTEKQYTEIGGEMIFEYQLKQSVVDSFPNTTGGLTYVLNRFRRDDPMGDFQYIATWSARVEASQIVLNEENIPFVVLAFPLTSGKQWNGNALNSLGGVDLCGDDSSIPCDLYSVTGTGETFEFNNSSSDLITISQNENLDLIVKQDVRTEQYARGIGLVYKMSTVLEYCTVGNCIGMQQIEKGFIIEQTLIETGVE